MKKIDKYEQKKIMLDILKFFDSVCRENSIDYSLFGGSLIGAVRHKGIIPWDDDIDVILEKANYDKIIDILSKQNSSRYKLLYSFDQNGYYCPFPKLVDTRTFLVEPQLLEPIDGYGIYIDIFCFLNLPNDKKKQIKFIKKFKLVNSMLSRKKIYISCCGMKQKFLRFMKNIISKIIGYKLLLKIVKNFVNKYDNLNNPKYVISNWPIYDIPKEIHLKKNIMEYIDVEFDGLTVKIFKNYDKILRTTFGNYMELPPINERKSHGLIAYWKDLGGNNEEE